MENLSRLKKVDLRKIWKSESRDFTPWLAQEDNIKILGDELGIEIDPDTVETEVKIGSFNADIVARESNTGRNVIIENQLESTDHDHLGKLITYASGYEASYIIWIVRVVRDEHKQAIDWLNEHTDEDLNFFLVKMEVWQIEESPYAPKFHIVSQPNDWKKSMRRASRERLTETEIFQLNFWTAFKEYLDGKKSDLKPGNPGPRAWFSIPLGVSKAHLETIILKSKGRIGVKAYIPDSKELYRCLEERKEEIEDKFGHSLEWMSKEKNKYSQIVIYKKVKLSDESKWKEYFEWLSEIAENLKKAIDRPLKECLNRE